MNNLGRGLSLVLVMLSSASCSFGDDTEKLTRLNPSGLMDPVNNGWTNVVISSSGTAIHVSGLTAKNEMGVTRGIGDMGAQVRAAFTNVKIALAAAHATPEDVVRMTTYTLDMDSYLREGFGQVAEFFDGKPPASTLVEVSRLADPDYLVEIEVTAVLN